MLHTYGFGFCRLEKGCQDSGTQMPKKNKNKNKKSKDETSTSTADDAQKPQTEGTNAADKSAQAQAGKTNTENHAQESPHSSDEIGDALSEPLTEQNEEAGEEEEEEDYDGIPPDDHYQEYMQKCFTDINSIRQKCYTHMKYMLNIIHVEKPFIQLGNDLSSLETSLWKSIERSAGSRKNWWNIVGMEPGFITKCSFEPTLSGTKVKYMDASFLHPPDFNSTLEFSLNDIKKPTPRTAWLGTEDIEDMMKAGRNCIQFTDTKTGKITLFNRQVCTNFKGRMFPTRTKTYSIIRVDEDNKKDLVMGMAVCERQKGKTHNVPESSTAVYMHEENECKFPYFMVYNTSTKKILCLGTNTFMRSDERKMEYLHCRPWVPRQIKRDGINLQHMKMYASLQEGGSEVTKWIELASLRIASLTAYAVMLKDGSVDLVIARNKLRLFDIPNHSNNIRPTNAYTNALIQEPMEITGTAFNEDYYDEDDMDDEDAQFDMQDHIHTAWRIPSSLQQAATEYSGTYIPQKNDLMKTTTTTTSTGARWHPWSLATVRGD